MSSSPYAPLVMWALGVRDSPKPSRSTITLARAVTPELVSLALEDRTIRRRLTGTVPNERHRHAIRSLAIIAGNRQLRHSSSVPLGAAFRHLTTASTARVLGIAVGTSHDNAARVLGNALNQVGAHTAVDLIEYVTLLTDWDHMDLRTRSTFLVDFHTTDRA